MKSKDKPNNNKDKEKKIILWEVKSFPAVEINKNSKAKTHKIEIKNKENKIEKDRK